ncbi:MAG: ISLre2 family transposase, partial [Clostridiales bacterium]|nr:ISLre2 family transposase [Clostridiales bacterium]
MDQYLRESAVRKKDWGIVRKDKTGLVTSFGSIKYERTYFKPKGEGKRRYLVDEIVGIKPHD